MKELIYKSLMAHQKFVTSDLPNAKCIGYYNEIFQEAYHIISTSQQTPFVALAAMEMVLDGIKTKANPFSSNAELKYKRLAISHINEVVITLHNRFDGHLR